VIFLALRLKISGEKRLFFSLDMKFGKFHGSGRFLRIEIFPGIVQGGS